MIPVYLRYRVFFGPTRVFLPSWAMLSAVFKKPSSPWEAMYGLSVCRFPPHLGIEHVKEQESEACSRKLVPRVVQHQLLCAICHPPELSLIQYIVFILMSISSPVFSSHFFSCHMQFLSIFQPVTPNYEVGADFLNHLLLLELDQAAIAVPHQQAR